MSLIRKTIRHAVYDALYNRIPGVNRKVWHGRSAPLQPSELPGIVINTPSTACEIGTNGPLTVIRNVEVVVLIVLADTDDAADRADEIAALVDGLLYQDDSFGERFEKFQPQSQDLRLEDGAENTVAVLECKYLCMARENLPDEVTLAALLEVDTKYHLQPTDNQVDAHDNQTLEQ